MKEYIDDCVKNKLTVRAIFISVWCIFLISLLLSVFHLKGVEVGIFLSGFALIAMYIFFLPQILDVPSDFNFKWFIYFVGIALSLGIGTIQTLSYSIHMAMILTLICQIAFISLIILTLIFKDKLTPIFKKVLSQIIIMHITVSFMFFIYF